MAYLSAIPFVIAWIADRGLLTKQQQASFASAKKACWITGAIITKILCEFSWDEQVRHNGTTILVRDVVNSRIFRERMGNLLMMPGTVAARVHSLEHDKERNVAVLRFTLTVWDSNDETDLEWSDCILDRSMPTKDHITCIVPVPKQNLLAMGLPPTMCRCTCCGAFNTSSALEKQHILTVEKKQLIN